MGLSKALSLSMFQNEKKISQKYFRLIWYNITNFKKMGFICNDKRFNYNNTNNKSSIRWCGIDCVKEHLIVYILE